MATLKDIKLRIDSIKNTQQITKAMKMVAASKMRKAEEAIVQARPYSDKLRGIVSNLSGANDSAHPLLEQRDGGKAVVLLITSDKGLCGGLNNNLCKNLVKFVPEHTADFEVLELVTFGKKGGEFFGSRNFDISDSFKNLKEKAMADKLSAKVQELIRQYENGKFNRLYIAFNRFKNVITQIPVIKQVLPVESPETEETVDEKTEFIFEPSTVSILSEILPQYVKNQAYTALLDNYACEHAARMTAMDAATTNAAEMIDKLQLQYNRARQAAITSELIEIISGAEAL